MVLVVVLVGVPRRTLMSAWIETRERTDLMATGIGRTLMSAWIETVAGGCRFSTRLESVALS